MIIPRHEHSYNNTRSIRKNNNTILYPVLTRCSGSVIYTPVKVNISTVAHKIYVFTPPKLNLKHLG